jgi:NhaP-type Na+/H+ and K+/H+ antiporter
MEMAMEVLIIMLFLMFLARTVPLFLVMMMLKGDLE